MDTPTLTMPDFPKIPGLSHLDVSTFINKPTLFIIWAVFLVGYIIVASILMYHWSKYGMRSKGIVAGQALFAIVSLSLFAIAGLSIYYF